MAVLQRDDPPVQQRRRLDPLPAEVVDQQAAAIALQLQRGFADVGVGIVPDLQAVHGQLAADDDRGPADLHPTLVVFVRLQDAAAVVLDRLVIRGVIQLDQLAVFHQGLRDPDVLAEATGDPAGDRRLAVARRPVEEHAGAGIDGRAKAFEEALVDGNVGEGPLELLALGGLGPNRLGVDRKHVVDQRHGGGPDVGAGLHGGLGPFSSQFSERVAVVVQRRRAGVDDDLSRSQGLQQAFQDSERQANVLGQTAAAGGADHGQMLADQRLDHRRGQARLFERLRRRGAKALVGKHCRQQTSAEVVRLGRHDYFVPEVGPCNAPLLGALADCRQVITSR